MKITADNYDELKAAMDTFLRAEIDRYVEHAGGKRALAAALGKSCTYIIMALRRDSIVGLEEVWRECRAKLKLVTDQ